MADPGTPDEVAGEALVLDRWLERLTGKHQENLGAAVAAMDRRSRRLMRQLETEQGRLVATRANLRQAQELHRQLTVIMGSTVIKYADSTIARDLDRIVRRSAKILTLITGNPQSFVGVDRTWIDQLKNLNLSQFHNLGDAAVDDVARAMYEHLMGGSRFSELQRTIQNLLVGRTDMAGRPMVTYARQMAFDTVRNHLNQVTLYKADKIGLTKFVYYGNVIRDSRRFCVTHAGEVMDDKRIAELDRQDWRGKSGPFRINRGGYNCRHHFLPMHEDWAEEEAIEVQSVFEE